MIIQSNYVTSWQWLNNKKWRCDNGEFHNKFNGPEFPQKKKKIKIKIDPRKDLLICLMLYTDWLKRFGAKGDILKGVFLFII